MKVEAYRDRLPLSDKLRRLVWNFCRAVFFRPFAGPLFWRWRNGVLRLFGAVIGEGSKVSAAANIWAPWNLEIGRFTALGPHADCYNPGKIRLGSKVVISQDSYLCTASHDITDAENPLVVFPVHVGSFAWVCARAIVLPGVTIGEGAVVGAGAVVTRDVEPWTVVAGNPARVVKKRVLSGPGPGRDCGERAMEQKKALHT